MPAGERTRLGAALLEAAGLETTALEDFLARLGTEDSRLAREVRRRVSVTVQVPNSFMAAPAAERLDQQPVSSAAEPLAPEAVSERYALGECLGHGGMARVFQAVDHKLSRTVALKFLTRDEPAIVRRFLSEARAQARVRHDNVLEVYDTGELEGQPYIAMRHVAGSTLSRIRDRISREQQVRLMIQVAEGLHAAHSKGLIHRDVKPSNILVEEQEDGELRAYVADFGIATEQSELGAADGALVGTPAYMAPELLGAPDVPLDRRVDVYSLGVTLYELFSGHRPFEHQDPMEVLRRVVTDEPPPPRRWAPSLPADLEAVVMRCLARDPDDRYPSARAVADDLRRFLAGEVVEAYTGTFAYRLTRFALRHRRLVTVAAVAAVLLVAASIAIAFFALRAESERARADQRRRQAEELIGFMVGDLREKLASAERLEVLDEVSAAALDYFAAVPAAELSDAELANRSRLLYQIGDVRIRKGDLVGAIPPLEESLDLARRLAERHPDDGQRLFDLGQSYFWLGYVRWRHADPAGARAPFEGYLETALRLTTMDPENLDWQQELSYAHSNLGSVLQDLGDLEGALGQFRSTLAIDQQLVARDPTNLAWRHSLAGTHSTLGGVLRSLGRLREARSHLQADLDLKRQLAAAEPASLRRREALGTSLEQLGGLLTVQGDLVAAERLFVESHRIFADLAAQDEQNTQWWYKLAWSRIWLGQMAQARGQLAAAAAEHQAVRRILESDARRNVSDPFWRRTVAVNLQYLAAVQAARGAADALTLAQTSVDALEQLQAEQPEDRRALRWLGAGHLLLGTLHHQQGEAAAARASWERAAEVLVPLVKGSQDGRWLALWAEALVRLGRLEEASPALESLQAQGFYAPELAALCRQQGLPWFAATGS